VWGDVVECERGGGRRLRTQSRVRAARLPGRRGRQSGLGDYGVPVELVDTHNLADVLDHVGGARGMTAAAQDAPTPAARAKPLWRRMVIGR
jgi:hypothetical protein